MHRLFKGVEHETCMRRGADAPAEATDNASGFHALQHPFHSALRDIEALSAKLPPDLAQAMNAPVPFKDATGLGPQDCVAPGAIRQPGRIGPLRQVIVAGGRAIGRVLQIGLDHRARTDGAAMAEAAAYKEERRSRPSLHTSRQRK